MNELLHDPVTLAYHELRSPLGLVATAMRALADDDIDDAVRARCEMVVRTVERLLRTTERVFGLARGADDERSWFAPAAVAAQVAADLRTAGIGVSFHDATDGAVVHAARGPFESLLQSLVSNAVDHGPAGGSVRIALAPTTTGVDLVVENEIAARDRHRGLGVGQYLCQRLAEQLGAVLSADRVGDRYRVSVMTPWVAPIAAAIRTAHAEPARPAYATSI